MIQGHLALSFISVIRYFTILGKEMYIKIVSFEKSNRLAIFIVTGLCHFKVMLLLLFKCRINSARVANSLILSKLWYVLQVVSATKEFLSSVVSLISGFISRRCFPRTSFDKMTLDRKSGSLGLLNPFIQQSSLQLRWLRPLLNLPNIHPDFWVADELQQSIVLPLLADYVIYHLELPCHTAILDSDYRLSFLFPGIRHSRLADRDSPMYLLFRAIDFRPKYFSGVEINLETTLRLLISAVVKPESTPIVGKSVLKLSVQDEYLIDPTTCTTRFRPPPPTEITHYPSKAGQEVRKGGSERYNFLGPLLYLNFYRITIRSLWCPPFTPITHTRVEADSFLTTCFLTQSGPRLTSTEYHEKCPVYPEVLPEDLPMTHSPCYLASSFQFRF